MTDDMPRDRLDYLRHEKSRHGKWRWYFRKDNGPRIRLHGVYRSREFMEAYAAALEGRTVEPVAPARTGSISWLVSRYEASGDFLALADSSRYMRSNLLKKLTDANGHVPCGRIGKKEVQAAMQKRAATPFQANNLLTALSMLFSYAVEHGHIKENPCDGVKPFRTKSDGHHTWSVDEVEQYRAKHPVGTRARLAMDLLLFTGLRRSDLIKIGRQHVKDGVLSIRTKKSGQAVSIPIFPELRASIDATKTGDLAFLVAERGRPFQAPESFGAWFRKRCDEAGLPDECTAHGVRKAGATIAANNGASAHELMAMYAWSRISMAERYTKAADHTRLARSAAERIANSFSPHPKEGAADYARRSVQNKGLEK